GSLRDGALSADHGARRDDDRTVKGLLDDAKVDRTRDPESETEVKKVGSRHDGCRGERLADRLGGAANRASEDGCRDLRRRESGARADVGQDAKADRADDGGT